MSTQAVAWVIDHSLHKGGTLLTLLMIANHAHSDGAGAYPSIKTLAAETRMSERQVRRNIEVLTTSGELFAESDAGPKGVTVYSLIQMMRDKMSTTPKPDSDDPEWTSETPLVDISAPLVDIHDSSFINRTKEPNKPNKEDLLFDEFWDAYPPAGRSNRKLEKKQAVVEWKKLTDAEQQRALIGAKHRAEDVANGGGFAKYAHRFLSKRLFEEWQTPALPLSDSSKPRQQDYNQRVRDEAFARRDKRNAGDTGSAGGGISAIGGLPGGLLDS